MSNEKYTRRQFLQKLGLAGISFYALNQLWGCGEKTEQNPPPSPTPQTKDTTKVITPEIIPVLAIAQNGTARELVRAAVEKLGGMKKFVSNGNIVVVKPNIAWDRTPELAANTNPEVVAEIVKMCIEAGAKKVKVFDRPCQRATATYVKSKIKEYAEAEGAEVTYTIDAGFVEMELPDAIELKKWKIYREAMECDTFINIPIAKHHTLTQLTLAMKNLMGILGGKRGNIHHNIHQKLADISTLRKSDLVIMDATRILTQGGPIGGNPNYVEEKWTVGASTDIIAIDAWATSLFGKKPEDITCIVNGHKMGLGEIDLSKVSQAIIELGTETSVIDTAST